MAVTALGSMPAIFFGHGSPMIALESNATTETWHRIGTSFRRPRGIVCVSAHWCTSGTAVTAMPRPRTIHDFGGFPQALFDMQYPAPGSPELAMRLRDLLAPTVVSLDKDRWGFDHGTWSVLCKAYPEADIPVVQLSMDMHQPMAAHYAMGQKLATLRDEGILVMGTGNIVHNLPRMNPQRDSEPYDWARRFHDYVRGAIDEDAPSRLINYGSFGSAAELAVPTVEHFLPLLYVIGARRADDSVRFEVDHIEHASLSMLTVLFEPAAEAA